MINLLKSEFYRLFNRVYLYVFWAIPVFISLMVNVLNSFLSMQISLYDMLSISLTALIIPIYTWPVLTYAVTGEEFKENTVVNTIAFGVSKTKLFLSKVIISAALVITTVFVTILTFAGSAFLFCTSGGLLKGSFFVDYLLAIFSALPLYIAAIIIGTLLTFWVKKNILAIFAYMGLFFFMNPFLSMLRIFGLKKLDRIYNALITTQLFSLIGPLHMVNIRTPHVHMDIFAGGNVGHGQMLAAAWIGLAYILVLIVMGVLTFKK